MNADLSAISPLSAYLGSFLGASIPAWLLILMATVVHWFFLLLPPLAVLGFLDRKLGADIQMRIGPNRVSPYGVAQVVADGVKGLFKEDSKTDAQEGLFFRWGVVGAIVCVFVAVSNIPMAENWALSNQESGLLCVVAAIGVSSLCMFWAAYSIESAWSVLSSFRVLVLIASYLVPVALAIIPPVMISGGANFDAIVRSQGGMPWHWVVLHDPGTFLSGASLFLALLIWEGRVPFDHQRGLGEIAGGYEAEYSGMRRSLLGFLEYISLFLVCALLVTTYFGGWRTPFNLESFGRAANLAEWFFFLMKIVVLEFLTIWIRWSLPRLRIDQIINLSWRVLVPLGLVGTAISAIWLVVFNGRGAGDFL